MHFPTDPNLIVHKSIKATMTANQWKDDREFHDGLLDADSSASGGHGLRTGVHVEEIRTAPLFSADVLFRVLASREDTSTNSEILPQYGLLAKVLEKYEDQDPEDKDSFRSPEQSGSGAEVERLHRNDSSGGNVSNFSKLSLQEEDKRLFVNINAPWSAFICGSQGSGKSHTLSCMLESSLMRTRLGPLSKPLAGMVFHYDKFTGFNSSQICEAAYLCSTGIKVKVLVSPTSFHRMKKVYQSLPGIPAFAQPTVMPLFLQEKQLNVERMMKLMAIEDEGRTALYMEVSFSNFADVTTTSGAISKEKLVLGIESFE